MNYAQLKQECIDSRMEYHTFEFPITYMENGVWLINGSGLQVSFSPDGLSYLLYRLRKFISLSEARNLYHESPAEFTEYVNAAAEQQKKEETWRGDNKLTAAINNHVIYGIMTKYEAVSNCDVLDLVEKWRMVDSLNHYSLTNKELNLYFNTEKTDKFEWGMCVKNGETGHVALGYHVYIKREDFIFTFPYQLTRRHMSRVNEVVDNLQTAYEEIKNLRLLDFLGGEPAKKYVLLLTSIPAYGNLPNMEQFIVGEKSLLDLIVALSNLRFRRGMKTAANNALKSVLGNVESYAFKVNERGYRYAKARTDDRVESLRQS